MFFFNYSVKSTIFRHLVKTITIGLRDCKRFNFLVMLFKCWFMTCLIWTCCIFSLVSDLVMVSNLVQIARPKHPKLMGVYIWFVKLMDADTNTVGKTLYVQFMMM